VTTYVARFGTSGRTGLYKAVWRYSGYQWLTEDGKKVKSTIPHDECWWGAHLPYLYRPWAIRGYWINHLSLWSMASVTPDLRLRSQSQDIAAPRLVPNYTALWCQEAPVWTTCPRSLPDSGTAGSWNSWPLESQANALTITPSGHTFHYVGYKFNTYRPRYVFTHLGTCRTCCRVPLRYNAR